ncbi:ATP-binding protein [Cohnella zeiphila]|uniref:histidine kinase n=1 Tax=Cohnella zeiphila TaxID=2761120 RepID=A0A7X0VUG5_9BACL|nr:ATP-binding protein [Cohnella zeiphila]MBB6730989.1 response regulator [Cohnella zeiphila]
MVRRLAAVSALLVCLLLPAYSVYLSLSSERGPVASAGLINLSHWDFDDKGTVALNGEWEFYRNQLLTPASFSSHAAERPRRTAFADLPGTWNSYMGEDGEATPYGYGTYRLRVRLPGNGSETWGIYTDSIRLSCRVYLNEWEVASCGRPDSSPERDKAANVPEVGYAAVNGNEVDILVQVSNYLYGSGGVVSPILFGEQNSVTKLREWRTLQDLILVAGFIVPAVYLLLIYRNRRQEKGLLHLGAFGISGAFFALTHGEKLISDVLPGLPYEWILKLQLISTTFGYYFLLRYCAGSVLGRGHRTLLRVMGGFCLLSLVLSLLPYGLYGRLEPIMFAYTLCAILYTLYLVVRNLRNGRRSVLEWIGMQSVLVIIILITMSVFGGWETRTTVTFEMLVFVLSQGILLAGRFSRSFRDVEQLSNRLLTLDGLKDEFLASTSHELKTPLHGMINMADSLLQGAAGPLNDKQARDLSMISSTGRRLSLLVRDILDLAQLKNGGTMILRRRAVQLPAVAASVLEVVKHTTGGRRIAFAQRWPEDLPPLEADEDRLAQILYNLLGNAVKYTPAGEVTISARTNEREAIVTVSDTGIGIPANKLDGIFLSFERLGVEHELGEEGTGLGLSITKRLVELSGGRIWVESTVGVGTSFHFTLPLASAGTEISAEKQLAAAAETEAEVPLLPEESSPPNGKAVTEGTVLIVDDDPVNLQVLVNLLSLDRYKVLLAESGEEALRTLRGGAGADLVIADWMMPGMSGLELCRDIRKRYPPSELPVLLLTARTRPEDVLAGFRAGINDFLGKPVDSGELRARARTLIQLRKSVQETIRTEMAFLQAQIKPHFLFNALNTIMATSQVDTDMTMELLGELSRYLRGSFDFRNREKLTTVDKEIELVRSYLHLEQARFGSRLRVEFELDEDRSAAIPPLTIQPIVENAVRHGVMGKVEGGTVRISVHTGNEGTTVVVSDDGTGMTEERAANLLSGPGEAAGGVGVINIHRRLLALFGQGLLIESEPGRGTTVRFSVPREGV